MVLNGCLGETNLKTRWGFLVDLITVFDPLGSLITFLLQAKIWFRDICQMANDNWDKVLDSIIQLKWSQWKKLMEEIEIFKIPRHVNGSSDSEIFCFSDAPKNAIGYCIYIYTDGSENGRLLCGRSKLADVAGTIPELELQALTWMIDYAYSEMFKHVECASESKTYFYSDSQAALEWKTRTKLIGNMV
jgi:Pao retrotransposon peptidase